MQDSYLDYVSADSGLKGDGPQIQNLAILQSGTCFTLLHRGTSDSRLNFEVGDESSPDDRDSHRFFWPLGGELDGDRLFVFWSEMEVSDPRPAPGDGIVRHPVATWLAEYDATTLERISFAPAPNAGVFPSYGLAVSSDGTHSYLFGNSNLLNLDRQGGFFAGPHSATRMFLARVPRGQLSDQPEYRTNNGWSSDPDDAVTISDRYWAENTMRPRFVDGQWISVSKVDGFWGDDIAIDVAAQPWGPWTTIERFTHEERPHGPLMNSYGPIILPWSNPDDGLILVISENAQHWPTAVENPVLYRPRALGLTWPSTIASASPSVPTSRLR